jgi:hypothetical protein
MKSNPKPLSPYFMPSPLKASNEEASQKPSPYLKAILSGKSRPMSQPRSKPMINPYRDTTYRDSVKQEPEKTPFQRLISSSKLPKDNNGVK